MRRESATHDAVALRTSIILDTNILVANFRPSNAFRLLLEASRGGQIQLVVPELVIAEAAAKYREQLAEAVRTLERSRQALRRFDVESDTPTPDAASEAVRYEVGLGKLFKGVGAKIAKTPSVPHDKLVRRALERRKRFRAGDAGYRDALIWETVVEHAGEGSPVVLCTMNTSDFAVEKGSDHLAADLLADLEEAGLGQQAVRLVVDLKTLVDEYVDVEQAATDEVVRALDRLRHDLRFELEDVLLSQGLNERETSAIEVGNLNLDLPAGADRATVTDAYIAAVGSLGAISVKDASALSADEVLATVEVELDVDVDLEVLIEIGLRQRYDTVTADRTALIVSEITYSRGGDALDTVLVTDVTLS